MNYQLGTFDIAILVLYGLVLVGMGVYFFRKTKTSEEFMVAGRGIPAWAAGIAVMSAYTSSISYIAVPGQAFDSNWHPLIFAIVAIPVAWFVTKFVIPLYRKNNIISVYGYLEKKIGENLLAPRPVFSILFFRPLPRPLIFFDNFVLLCKRSLRAFCGEGQRHERIEGDSHLCSMGGIE